METNVTSEPDKLITSHGVGMVIYKLSPSRNRLDILGMPYSRYGSTTLRVPFGTQGDEKEGLIKTFEREMRAEVSGLDTQFTVEHVIRQMSWWQVKRDERATPKFSAQRCLHLQAFMAVEFKKGSLRTSRLIEHEGTGKEEILDPPMWYEVSDLLRRMAMPHATIFGHRLAVMATLAKLAGTEDAIDFRYSGLIESGAGLLAQEREKQAMFRPAVTQYLTSFEK